MKYLFSRRTFPKSANTFCLDFFFNRLHLTQQLSVHWLDLSRGLRLQQSLYTDQSLKWERIWRLIPVFYRVGRRRDTYSRHRFTTPSFNHCYNWLCHRSQKLSANEQFFVGAQTVVSLLQTTQIISDVCFITDYVPYASSNKTKIVWIETELFFYPGWMRLMFTCMLGR